MIKNELTVLMCAYNAEKYISEAIESILNQTFNKFEFIIINDGSTDKTREIIESYNDDRIKLYNFKTNKGISEASRFGLTKVNSKYIAKADADDVYLPDRFLKQKEFLDTNLDVELVGTHIEYFTNDEEIKKTERYCTSKNYFEKQINSICTCEDMHEKLFWFCSLVNSTIMGKTETIKKYGYNENWRVSEDYKLFYDMNKDGLKITNIDEVLSRIRISKASLSCTNKDDIYTTWCEIKNDEIREFFLSDKREVYIWGAGGFGQNILKIFRKKGYKVSGFIDGSSKKWGEELLEYKIKSPQEIVTKEKKVKVIVASDPGRYDIINSLRDNGYKPMKDFTSF